ncbi:hypothetical protein CI102_15041 [Trichoderma harzianum]|nr:hypothetical protein CI102_15041 [Trichoderma harzianum]
MKVNIDLEGDILLQLSQKTVDDISDDQSQQESPGKQVLAVSSKILCLASPVFNTMLGNSFKEAVDLIDHKATLMPYCLDLPEDDPEAMTVFCKIIYFNSDNLTETPTAAFLEKLAYICDKYQCTGPMKYCGAVWNHDEKTTSIDDLCQILIFAYVLDLSNEFTEAAWRLFLYHKGPFTGPCTQVRKLEGHPLMPDSIIGMEAPSLNCALY